MNFMKKIHFLDQEYGPGVMNSQTFSNFAKNCYFEWPRALYFWKNLSLFQIYIQSYDKWILMAVFSVYIQSRVIFSLFFFKKKKRFFNWLASAFYSLDDMLFVCPDMSIRVYDFGGITKHRFIQVHCVLIVVPHTNESEARRAKASFGIRSTYVLSSATKVEFGKRRFIKHATFCVCVFLTCFAVTNVFSRM